MILLEPSGLPCGLVDPRPNIKRPIGRFNPNPREQNSQNHTFDLPEVTLKRTKLSLNKYQRPPKPRLRAGEAKP